MSQKRKAPEKRRTAIVPRAVFAAAVAISSVPALAGCSNRTTTSVAAMTDLGFSVAAHDSGTDGSRDGASADGSIDAGAPHDLGPDITFSVAAPIDLGPARDATFTVAVPPDAFFTVAARPDATFTVAVAPDASFTVAARPDAFFAVAAT